MDSKDNLQIGTSSGYRYTFKFRATQSSTLSGFRLQWRSGPVYSGTAGNYGLIQISLRPDDGSGKPSNTVLATVDVDPAALQSAPYDNSFIRTTSFPQGASIQAGQLYHLHMQNVHPNPNTSYISVNTVFVFSQPVKVLGRNIPHFADADFGTLRYSNGAWSVMAANTPIVDLIYTNGQHDGFAYQAVMIGAGQERFIGGNEMVRERFVVQGGDRVITKLWARVGRISGSSPVTLRLESDTGVLLDQCAAVGSDSIAIVTPGPDGGSKGTWVGCTLGSTQTILNGQTYNLGMSAPSGTTYLMAVVLTQDSSALNGAHDMRSYGFNEGHGEYSTDGGLNWDYAYGSWYHNSTQTVMETAP